MAGRLLAVGAIVAACVVIVWLLFGSSGGHTYKLIFETGGQLVPDNEVLVGGTRFGNIDSIELTDNNQAEVTITVDEPLREGTEAIVRATSLSGVANRYISLTLGPNNAPELEEGATLSGEETTAPVDLDQL